MAKERYQQALAPPGGRTRLERFWRCRFDKESHDLSRLLRHVRPPDDDYGRVRLDRVLRSLEPLFGPPIEEWELRFLAEGYSTYAEAGWAGIKSRFTLEEVAGV